MTRRCNFLGVLLCAGCATSGVKLGAYKPVLDVARPVQPEPPHMQAASVAPPPLARMVETVTGAKLPDFSAHGLGFSVEPLGSPVLNGMSLAGAVGLAGTLIGGAAAVARAAEQQRTSDLSLRLSMGLLRSGMTRFVDLRWLRDVAVTASGTRFAGLSLQASLDVIALLGLYDRAEYVLLISGAECSDAQAAVERTSRLDPVDRERYSRQLNEYRSKADAYAEAVTKALNDLDASFAAAIARYRQERDRRTTREQAGDWLAQVPDEEPAAREQVAQLRESWRTAKSAVLVPLPTPGDFDRSAETDVSRATLPRVACTIRATLVDSHSGATMWAYRGVRESGDRDKALDGALADLVTALQQGSNLKPAKLETRGSPQPDSPVPEVKPRRSGGELENPKSTPPRAVRPRGRPR